MSVGFVMLAHGALDRAARVARHLAAQDAHVVIHVDTRVRRADFEAFREAFGGVERVTFARRRRCEWGTWSIVAATLDAAEQLLSEAPDVDHVYLVSGSCLPLRPVSELHGFLADHPDTDFIESVTIADMQWTVGGLDKERFSLSFPFSWKRHRLPFDLWVALQRRLGLRRRVPQSVAPHLGSQWWCLTRETLERLLNDPRRGKYARFFRRVWIPDESYFQTIVRFYARRLESRSLTLSKFDFLGKPHTFYDDHLQFLRRSDCFFARKIWPGAERLYRVFLDEDPLGQNRARPNPAQIDRYFARALDRRTRGRTGLYMSGRHPNPGWENGKTAARYSVLSGFGELYEGFKPWLTQTTGTRVHGRLFAPERAEFAEGASLFAGGLSDAALVRDHNPEAFLTNLIWNTRGERQSFFFGPADQQHIGAFLSQDANAQIAVIRGAWCLPLFARGVSPSSVRGLAAEYQAREAAWLSRLRSADCRADVRVWSLEEAIEAPMHPLQALVDQIGSRLPVPISAAPQIVDLTGFREFLQALRNEGMHPHLVGTFPVGAEEQELGPERPMPALLK